MPTRILREGILSSDKVNELEPAGEVFYRRLMSKVDDHGLYDARPSILRASLYPLKLDRVREADISRWMAECQKAGLIVFYEAGGKPYLRMQNTNWQTRSGPKYPLPPPDSNCVQPLTPATVVVVEDVVGVGRKRRPPKTDCPQEFEVTERMTEWAVELGFPASAVMPESEKFLSHHRSKGSEFVDWGQAWQTWMRKAVEYRVAK